MSCPLTIVREYAASVRSGEMPACKMVKLAVERWYADWERDDVYFDKTEFNRFVKFSKALKHFKGEAAGRDIQWEPWQLFVCANIFGWHYKATHKRRYTYADVFVPRKNGKTTLAAVIALYMLLLDNEPAAEVYAAAVDKAQAKICFDTSSQIIKNSPLADMVREYRMGSGALVVEDTSSAYKPFSKDSKNKDGLNPHCVICDERHAWKTNDIFDVVTSGLGARTQPLIFSISTAGFDRSYPYYEHLEYLRQVMLGIKTNDRHFIMLYEPDEGDRWDDPEVWRKVNPNYGVSLIPQYMQDEYQKAKDRGGSTLVNFETKNLNMWVDTPEVWINDDKVRACNYGTDPDSLLGCECYGGLDFASHVDIIAFELYFPTLPNKPVRSWYWLPEAKLGQSSDVVDYRAWKEQGWLRTTEGEVIDIDYLVADILEICKDYHVKNIAFDPYKAYHGLIQGLQQGGLDSILSEFSQGMKNMSEPTKELERLVTAGEIDLMRNPVLEWMFRNCTPYYDPNDNVKLFKGRARNKIDGVIALINAIGGYMAISVNNKPAYQNHTLRII